MKFDCSSSSCYVYKEKDIVYGDLIDHCIKELTISITRKFSKKVIVNNISHKLGVIIVEIYKNLLI